MKTRKEQMTAGSIDGYNNFIGDDSAYQDWYSILGQSRDSDALERSNFRVGLRLLGGESDTVRVERYRHWACGWIEEIYIKPNSGAYKIAVGIENSLDNYPVLDDDDYSMELDDEACEVWLNCYSWRDRIEYIRENRSQFEFMDFRDLLGCIRGNYFTGYASELLA